MLFFCGSSKRSTRPSHVPLLEVIEYFDLEYRYSGTSGTVDIQKDGRSILFAVGSKRVFIGDRIVHLVDPVYEEGGVLYVPSDGVDAIMKNLLHRTPRWIYAEGSFSADRLSAQPRSQSKRTTSGLPPRHRYEIQAIVIDPGHGGKDPGGMGYNNVREKDIVLGVAKEIERLLKSQGTGKLIVMTREDDSFVSLEERGRRANEIDPEKNPIFVSIHANVSYDSKSMGYESYFLSLHPLDETARDVASRENAVLNFEVTNYDNYLQEIINRIVDIEYRRESMKLAGYIQERMKTAIGKESVDRGVKSAFFYVLKAAKMPSVLVEIGFVTNKEEVARLKSSEYKKRVAEGVVEGIDLFVKRFLKTEGFTQ